MQNLNDRERAVLDYIRRVTMEKGYAPSVRDIGAALGLKSTSTVQMYLERLCDYGYIRREVGKSRSIALCGEQHVRAIPILREGACVGDVSDGRLFEGFLDFCYCGELPADATLFACRMADSDGYAVILRGAEDMHGKPVAVQTAHGVRMDAAYDTPQNARLGSVIAVLQYL